LQQVQSSLKTPKDALNEFDGDDSDGVPVYDRIVSASAQVLTLLLPHVANQQPLPDAIVEIFNDASTWKLSKQNITLINVALLQLCSTAAQHTPALLEGQFKAILSFITRYAFIISKSTLEKKFFRRRQFRIHDCLFVFYSSSRSVR
jgi:hypothetical protein